MSLDFQKVCDRLESDNVFLTGGAGVGKSYTTNQIINEYKKAGKGVVALGSTGVSAVAIGGVTLHSFFVFGISDSLEALSSGDKRSKSRLKELSEILDATELIIIDEISMVSSSVLDMIYYRLGKMKYKGQILFVGDFYQLPPIQKNSGIDNGLFSDRLYAFESDAWASFAPVVIELTQMHRTNDLQFTQILSKIRQGICDDEVTKYLLEIKNNNISENSTYLFGRNAEVDSMNREKLVALYGKEEVLISMTKQLQKIDERRVVSWKNMLPVSDILALKVGAPVLFCVNKWGKFANGEHGIVKEINDEFILVEKSDKIVRVEPHLFELTEIHLDKNGKLESSTLATLSQFPLRLAYAITIHKSQGMSIDRLVCNLDNIFAPSQLYVALSRAISPNMLSIDFNRGDFELYLKKMINVDSRVCEYYRGI